MKFSAFCCHQACIVFRVKINHLQEKGSIFDQVGLILVYDIKNCFILYKGTKVKIGADSWQNPHLRCVLLLRCNPCLGYVSKFSDHGCLQYLFWVGLRWNPRFKSCQWFFFFHWLIGRVSTEKNDLIGLSCGDLQSRFCLHRTHTQIDCTHCPK